MDGEMCPIRPQDPTSDAHAAEVLRSVKTIAVLGVHVLPHKAASYVPEYLVEQGYEVFGVNPGFRGRTLFGRPVVATLSDLAAPVDMVNVFRRSDRVIRHADEILAMPTLPRVVWLQLGIRNDEAAARWLDAGIDVVQDRCTLADHRRLLR